MDANNWGLTASDDPNGYSAHEPYSNDNGTITPTAAIIINAIHSNRIN